LGPGPCQITCKWRLARNNPERRTQAGSERRLDGIP
jgi:hypothetical protein